MGELGTLQLNANGAVIGRPRRCDSGCSSMPRRHADHPDSSRYINAAHVAKHREKADTSRSRDYTGLKPEAVITSAIDVRSDTFNRDESRRRSTSDVIDRSRDKQHPLPFGRGDTTRRQPEAVCAGWQRSRQCGRSADGKDIRLRTGRHHRRGTDDAGGTDVVRATNDCHKQRHRRNYNHAEIDHITRSTVNVALAALQPRATTSKTELRHKGVTSKVEGRTSHHHHQFRAAPQARYQCMVYVDFDSEISVNWQIKTTSHLTLLVVPFLKLSSIDDPSFSSYRR